jgi:hypothetical protein
MSTNKVPGVMYPRITFASPGNSENQIGVGAFSIGASLPNGNQMDIADILFQNTPVPVFNAIDAKFNETGSMEAMTQRASINRRLSKKQAAWLTRELVAHLNRLVADGMPHDDDLPA